MLYEEAFTKPIANSPDVDVTENSFVDNISTVTPLMGWLVEASFTVPSKYAPLL